MKNKDLLYLVGIIAVAYFMGNRATPPAPAIVPDLPTLPGKTPGPMVPSTQFGTVPALSGNGYRWTNPKNSV